MKRTYMIVYNNDIATYVNAYEKGKIVDSEVFWKEDDVKLSDIDMCIKYFKKTYNIEKIYNEQAKPKETVHKGKGEKV